MDNFFTSPSLLRLLKGNGMAATGTVRANRTENAPLQAVDDIRKRQEEVLMLPMTINLM